MSTKSLQPCSEIAVNFYVILRSRIHTNRTSLKVDRVDKFVGSIFNLFPSSRIGWPKHFHSVHRLADVNYCPSTQIAHCLLWCSRSGFIHCRCHRLAPEHCVAGSTTVKYIVFFFLSRFPKASSVVFCTCYRCWPYKYVVAQDHGPEWKKTIMRMFFFPRTISNLWCFIWINVFESVSVLKLGS